MPAATYQEISYQTLVDEFLTLYRSCQIQTVEEFALLHPNEKSVILSEFPAILCAESFRPREEDSSILPSRIGPYIIRGELGRGGMGSVYAAWHEELDREVAIKVLTFHGAGGRRAAERFRLEARAGAMLNHPNIVPVYDHGALGKLVYMVMYRVRGISLSKMVSGLQAHQAKGTQNSLQLDWNYIANLGAQVASALTYAHEQGVIHRDIKPANLLLDESGKVWVTDFGLAKLLESNIDISRTGDIIGTPRYMSPEQCRGVCDARSDLYGLGLTLYELACGKKVWEKVAAPTLVGERSSLELPDLRSINPACPESLAKIIMRACEFKPEDRYQTAREMNYVLTRFAHGHDVGDRRKRKGSRSFFMRRSVLMIGGAASLCTTAALCYGVYYFTRKQDPFRDPVAAMSVLKDVNLRKEFIKELPVLISNVVQTDDPQLRAVVGDLAHEAINDTVEQYDIAEDDKAEIRSKVGGWVDSYKDGKMTVPMASAIFQNVAQSPIGAAMNFQRVAVLVERSGFNSTERMVARDLLQRLTEGIVNRRVTREAVGRLQDILDTNNIAEENAEPIVPGQPPLVLSDESLRIFFRELNGVLTSAGLTEPAKQLRVSDTVKSTVEQALHDPQLQHLIQELQKRRYEVPPQSPSGR